MQTREDVQNEKTCEISFIIYNNRVENDTYQFLGHVDDGLMVLFVIMMMMMMLMIVVATSALDPWGLRVVHISHRCSQQINP